MLQIVYLINIVFILFSAAEKHRIVVELYYSAFNLNNSQIFFFRQRTQ